MSLVAQCFEPVFLHGTVAATRSFVALSDGIVVQSVTPSFNPFQFEEIQHGRGQCDQDDSGQRSEIR
jgi:hypothetical protein